MAESGRAVSASRYANVQSNYVACNLLPASVGVRRASPPVNHGVSLFNVLRQNVSGATLFQLGAELSWLFAAILLILRLDGLPFDITPQTKFKDIASRITT